MNSSKQEGWEEPEVQLREGGRILLTELIRERRSLYNPTYKPIFVAASHLSLSVQVSPPTKLQRSVLTGALYLLQLLSRHHKPKIEEVSVLNDVSFYLRPNQMTLILGAPGNLSPAVHYWH